MNRYRVQFRGRPIGSIGIIRHVSLVLEGPDAETAALKRYETHEHCSEVWVTSMGPVESEGGDE